MQVRIFVFLLSLVCLLSANLNAQRRALAAPPHETGQQGATPAAELPVTRVSLYKNGVGFFEHTGHITGDSRVTIDFTTDQLNDVLQSLTAVDLNGGRIAGADYNSTTPVEQQLRALPLGLGTDPTEIDFYNAIRGARVEVHAAGPAITGRLMNLDVITTPATDNKPATERRLLTVVSDSGEVRTIELTPTTQVRLLDGDLRGDVTRYLELLASTRNQGLRHLTLQDNGTGARELHVSYISEVPIWKSTYRILFTEPPSTKQPGAPTSKQTATLQGWSVIDNTTGSDWNNVQLSLIAGAPQSFIQPLSVPYYSRRPEIPLPQEAQLSPQTHESGEQTGNGTITGSVRDASGAVIPNAAITITNESTGASQTLRSTSSGSFSAGIPAGRYRIDIVSPGFQRYQQQVTVAGGTTVPIEAELPVGSTSESVMVTPAPPPPPRAAMAARLPGGVMGGVGIGSGSGIGAGSGGNYGGSIRAENYIDSFATNATTNAFDDYFEYRIAQPVTIRKNESAMVPILQEKVDAERVTLWSARQPQTPLRALWITNTSNLTLDRGSFSILEDGNFGGEGLLDPVHPGEKRLLSYAVDQAVRVTTDYSHNTNRITEVTAAKGVLELKQTEIIEEEYLVHNAATDPRTIIVEQPIRPGFTLDSDPKPEETTSTVYRFRVLTQPRETVRLHIGERRLGTQRYVLTSSNDQQLTFILNQTGDNPTLKQALQPILDARRRVADAQQQVDRINASLTSLRSDEERERANVTALASTDKASRERFVRELNTTEDAIAAAQKDLATAQEVLQKSKDDLATRIESFQLDQKL